MNKESFLDLLDRYQQNRCTEDEKLVIEQWYGSLNKEEHLLLTSLDLKKMNERILERLYANMQRQTNKVRDHIAWHELCIAATIILAMVCTFLYTYSYNNAERAFKNENAGRTLISKTNNSDDTLLIKLSDLSLVTLQPHAKITYPTVFANNRRLVYLQGDAFFLISKNHKKPFYVYNHELQVKVLGTSFFINEAKAQVSVRTGKVQVNENANRALFTLPGKKHAEGVLITPNQKAIFDDSQHHIQKTLVDEPIPLYQLNKEPESISFKFSDTKLKDVFDRLSRAYGISFLLEDHKIYDCAFTGDLEHKSLHEQLNLICQSISGSYQVKDTNIIITGKNCN